MLGLSIPIMPMRQAGVYLPAVYLGKLAIFVHRWLGLAFCLIFALWFISGIVMMYSDYPNVGSQERLSKGELAQGAIRLTPQAAYPALHKSELPDQVVLTMLRTARLVEADVTHNDVPLSSSIRTKISQTGRHSCVSAFETKTFPGRPTFRATFDYLEAPSH